MRRYTSPALSQARRSSRQTSSGLPQRSVQGVSRQVSLYEIPPQRDGIEWKTSPAQLSDLAALTQNRLYRNQELVWYILDKPLPITAHSHPEITHVIRLWPGIARTTVCPFPPVERPTGAAERSKILYFITVTTLNRTYVVPQTSIIPFQSYRPDENLLVEFRSMGADIPLNAFDRGFDPLPRSSALETSLSFDTGTELSPLELLITDIKIANKVASTWSVADGFSPNSSTLGQNQRRYRGLWFGAERIWTGDLLILSFSESGIDFGRKSSTCFVQDAPAEEQADGSPLERRNPEDKQVFLKLRSLIPVATKDGIRIYAAGDLHRLLRSSGFAEGSLLEDGVALPRPPDGFVFRPMLSTSIEAKFPVDLIRGRYYPWILSLVDRKFLPEERMLESMEGCRQVDPAIQRPIKHTKGSREDLLDVIRKSVLQVE